MLHQTGGFQCQAIYRCHLNLHQLDPCCHGNENLGIGVVSYGSLGLAYVDLRAAFDSVDRNALWLLLRSLGIPPKLSTCSMTFTQVRTSDLNFFNFGALPNFLHYIPDTVSCVRLEGEVSDWFHFSCGVRQGCTVAPSLFLNSSMQWTGSLNAHLTEGSWRRHWAQRPLLTSTTVC